MPLFVLKGKIGLSLKHIFLDPIVSFI